MDYNAIANSSLLPTTVVGSVQKLFGTNGELVIKLWDTFPENTKEPLWVDFDSLAVPLFLQSFRKQGQSKAVVVFDDFESEALSEMLIGKKLHSLVALEILLNDFSYLKAFTLVDLTSGREFKIVDYIESDLNPLLELEGDLLVPIAAELIESVSEKKKRIEVCYPEGIFDL